MWSIVACLIVGFSVVLIWHISEDHSLKWYFKDFCGNFFLSLFASVCILAVWFLGTTIAFEIDGTYDIENYTLEDTDNYYLSTLNDKCVYANVSSNEYVFAVQTGSRVEYKTATAGNRTIVRVYYDEYTGNEKPMVFYDYYKGGTSWFEKHFTFYQYTDEITIINLYIPKESVEITDYSTPLIR